jgi:hypothetical protein
MHKLIARIRHKPVDEDATGHHRHHHLLAVAIVAAVIVAIVVLHLTGGIGTGSH